MTPSGAIKSGSSLLYSLRAMKASTVISSKIIELSTTVHFDKLF